MGSEMCIRDRHVNVPEGEFNLEVGQEPFKERIRLLRGEKSVNEWDSFVSGIRPLSRIVSEIPLLSSSPETINFLEIIKLASKFLPNIKALPKLNGGVGDIVDSHLNDPFLRNWVDLLSFLISGMPMHLSLIHISEPRDRTRSRMPSSA